MSYKTDQPCIICEAVTENGNCFHHIKTRASGGSDEPHNMMPVCKKHHNEIHSKGNNQMCKQYPQFQNWLKNNGWRLDGYINKWWHKLER